MEPANREAIDLLRAEADKRYSYWQRIEAMPEPPDDHITRKDVERALDLYESCLFACDTLEVLA